MTFFPYDLPRREGRGRIRKRKNNDSRRGEKSREVTPQDSVGKSSATCIPGCQLSQGRAVLAGFAKGEETTKEEQTRNEPEYLVLNVYFVVERKRAGKRAHLQKMAPQKKWSDEERGGGLLS